jgi:hypothetical protein
LGKTGANGHIEAPLKTAGRYCLRAIHMEQVSDPAVMADGEKALG